MKSNTTFQMVMVHSNTTSAVSSTTKVPTVSTKNMSMIIIFIVVAMLIVPSGGACVKTTTVPVTTADSCSSDTCGYGGSCVPINKSNYSCSCPYSVLNTANGNCSNPCSPNNVCGQQSKSCTGTSDGFQCDCTGYNWTWTYTDNTACSMDATCGGCYGYNCTQNSGGGYQCDTCFFGEDTVRLVNGEYRSIAKLASGDRVWSLGSDGKIIEDEVMMIMHMEPHEQAFFYTFTTFDGESISLTGSHFIQTLSPSSSSSDVVIAYLEASQITLAHRLFVSGRTSPVPIVKITSGARTGFYSPLTLSGTLLVNNISASCYAAIFDMDHELKHEYMKSLRIYHRFTRWIYGRNYHPFAVQNYQHGFHPFIDYVLKNRSVVRFIFDFVGNMFRLLPLVSVIVLLSFGKNLNFVKTQTRGLGSLYFKDMLKKLN